jgi:hypothetical protein
MRSVARTWLLLGLACLLGSLASAADLKNRSTSRTGQFIVYCDDRELRSRVVSFAEELKADTLQVLRETDGWSSSRAPIVVTIDPAEPGAKVPPAQVRWVNTVAGPKIDVVVRIGNDPAQVYLQSHLLKAMLLEISYRHSEPPTAYVEPPWWLVEGILETIRARNGFGGADIFQEHREHGEAPVARTVPGAAARALGDGGGRGGSRLRDVPGRGAARVAEWLGEPDAVH